MMHHRPKAVHGLTYAITMRMKLMSVKLSMTRTVLTADCSRGFIGHGLAHCLARQ